MSDTAKWHFEDYAWQLNGVVTRGWRRAKCATYFRPEDRHATMAQCETCLKLVQQSLSKVAHGPIIVMQSIKPTKPKRIIEVAFDLPEE